MDTIRIARHLVNIAKHLVASPNLGKYEGFCFFVYSLDTEKRSHVFASKDGKQAKFWLEPSLRIADDGGFSEDELATCLLVIKNHLDEFKEKFLKKTTSGEEETSVSPVVVIPDRISIVKSLLRCLDLNRVVGHSTNVSDTGAVFDFEISNGIEPWIEVLYVKERQMQTVHLDVTYPDGRKFTFDSDVAPGEEDKIAGIVNDYVNKAYMGVNLLEEK